MIKTVLIDIDGTLLDFNKCAKASIISTFKDFNIDYPEDFYSTFKRINDSLWLRLEKNEITFKELHDTRFNLVLGALGIDFDGITFELKFREYLGRSVEQVDGALEILKYLSEKYFVAVASNGPFEQQKRRLKLAGFAPYIKEYFVSSAVGHEKPNAGFFEYAFSNTPSKDKEELIIIGDSLTADIAGGENFGIKTCWFNPNNLSVKKGINPTYTINTLLQLKNIL